MSNYNEQLKYAIEALAQARANVEAQQTALKVIEIKTALSPLGVELGIERATLEGMKAKSAFVERQTRELILAQYAEDHDKHPHPAVTVKEFTSVQVDSPKTVIAWVEKNLPAQIRNALIKRSIDKAQLKKALNLTSVDGAHLVRRPRPTISKDLSDYLPAQTETPEEKKHE